MSDSGVLGTNGIVGASNQPLFSSDSFAFERAVSEESV